MPIGDNVPTKDKLIKKTARRKRSKQELQGKRSIQSKQQLQGKLEEIPWNKRGLKSGDIRATLILKEKTLDKVKALAYWERKDIKEVINEALDQYLKGKKIKPLTREGK
jgi:hypothetical protein